MAREQTELDSTSRRTDSTTSLGIFEELGPYVQIARFDHWFKNIFMIPGVLLALYGTPAIFDGVFVVNVIISLLAFGFVASSNYVINEVLDADRDALHPVKRFRPVPSGQIVLRYAYIEWIVLAVIGIALSTLLGWRFFVVTSALWVMGLLYNIPPIRCKDKVYLDVLSESINNPLRLLGGWFAVGMTVIPPISLVAAYWMIGAFFMTVKRLGEYRRIGDSEVAARYRTSFAYYTEEKLLISTIYYAVVFGLLFGIFITRYRIELLLMIPLIGGFIGYYIRLGFLPDSPTQYPERLYREGGFMLYMAVCVVATMILLFIDLPMLHEVFTPTIQTQSR